MLIDNTICRIYNKQQETSSAFDEMLTEPGRRDTAMKEQTVFCKEQAVFCKTDGFLQGAGGLL